MCIVQFMTIQMIEIANIGLLLFTNGTVNLVSNFVALAVVAEFDEFVY